MTDSGIAQAVRERAFKAGLDGFHLHEFRHGFAHRWLSEGGQENDLMQLAGWKSRQMVSRYAAGVADERARETGGGGVVVASSIGKRRVIWIEGITVPSPVIRDRFFA